MLSFLIQIIQMSRFCTGILDILPALLPLCCYVIVRNYVNIPFVLVKLFENAGIGGRHIN